MIKQTRGALTMLLSVYRSVLKNAYLKNFAAVALAASVGVASAEGPAAPEVSELLKLDSAPIELTTDAAITAGTENEGNANAASATVNDINISNDSGTTTLSITAKAGTNGTATLTVNEGKTLTVKNGGKVVLKGDVTEASETVIPNAATINGKIVLDAGDAETSTPILELASGRTVIGDVNVKNGTLTVTGGTALAESINSEAKGKITVATGKTMYVEKDLTLSDGATLSNEGSILTVGTATIGKLADGAKLGNLAFAGKANFTQTEGLTIDTSDTLGIQSDAVFAGNVENKGSITLFKTSSLTVNGAEGLNNSGLLNVAPDADAKVNAKLKSSGTIEVASPLTEGLVTKVAFADDVVNSGSITLNEGSDVTFAGALTNSGTVTSTGNLTVTGKLTNDAGAGEASSSKITLAKATLGEVDNAKGKITVSSKGNANFTGKLENKSDGTVEVLAGDSTTKTVASFANVVNAGTITLGANSDVSFKTLANSGTLDSSAEDLDLVGKLTNTGIVKVTAGKLKASLENLGIGVEDADDVKVVNADGATLDLGDKVELADNIFTTGDVAKKIKNSGTIKVGTLTLKDTAETNADAILSDSGKISVDTLNLNKGLNAASNLTVANKVSTEDKEATLGSSGAVNLINDGKVSGTVSGFKSVVAKIAGLWDLGKADLGTATIDGATVSNVGKINGATIGGTTRASVTANTVEAATIGNGSTVTATTVNAATLTNESVLNAKELSATANASDSAPIQLTNSTLNVDKVSVEARTNEPQASDVAIKASAGSTVKITGEYKAVTNGFVANLAGSTLELNANNNKSVAGTETITGDATSTLVINGVLGPVKLSTNTELQNALTGGDVGSLAGVYKQIGINSTNFTGQIKGLTYNTEGVVSNGQITLTEIGDYSTIASSTDAFATAQVTGAGTVASGTVLNVGSLEIDSGSASSIEENVTLNKAAANGNFIYVKGKTGEEAIAGAGIASGKTLTLNGDGTIGDITAGTNQSGILVANGNKIDAGDIGATSATLGTLEVKSGELTAKAVYADTTTVNGNLVAESLNAATATINGGLTLKTDANVPTSGILTAATLGTGANSNVIVDKIVASTSATLNGKVTASDVNTGTLTIGDSTSGSEKVGVVTVGKLSAASSTVTVNNGSLKVAEDASGVILAVNKAGSATFDKNLTLANATSTINGQLKVAGTLTTASGNKLTVGSVTGNATGSVYADTLLGTGGIFIDPDFGQQASGIGSMHLDNVTNPGYETTTQDIVVGKNAFNAIGVSSVDQARSVLSSLGLTDANGSFKQNGVENAIYTDALVKLNGTKLEINSGNTSGTSTASAGQILLADKSAVVIGKNAAAKSVQTGNAVLTANHGTVGVNVTGKSKVIFAGNPTKQDIKDVKVFANAGSGAVISNADDVSVQISPLYNEAKLTADGGITDITVNRGFINTALYNASLPVKNMVAEVADTALTGDGVGSDFIMENALVDGGANIESAARLATFGGAYQAAAAAVNTGIDAAQARLGLGIDNSAEVKGENVSVWANAVYKNTESDSFEAQGATYGADLDLTSLVIGADYGIAEGSKIGAYASFGTGDVDGKGAGHNVKNDVDTYGFGIYGSTKLASGVSILSDVGYTVAQNEFKGIVSADADMKVFTAGANVKYTFNTQVADITPFVGARYTSFNLENYAVKSAKGIVANTDADTAHVFSIPVGFDLSKQIAAGEWNVKPALTAKVTFNTGDKTVSSSTQFTGVKNALNLDAEVMDDVTYSVGASVSATKGAATFGAGLSYTGSSETNELSAQVGARYTF